MKPLLCLLLMLWSATVVSQKNKDIGKAPPGTVRVNDTLFVDKTEVTNVGWREYLYFLNRFDSLSLQKALPDTLVWGTDTTYGYDSANNTPLVVFSNNPMAEYYLRHPGFNNYPVVGISYEQAITFCKWRTLVANFNVYCKENDIKDWQNHLKDSFPIKYFYRLPSKEEWETIAAGKLSVMKYPYGYDSVYKKWGRKYYKALNCKFPNDTPVYHHWGGITDYTRSAQSYYPNSSGTYNMVGNVAEMVSEERVAKGGSFVHQLEECKISNNQYYTKPERWLGFRCVAVVIK